MKVPWGGISESFLSILTVPLQDERTLGRGQGVLPQHNTCSYVRRKVLYIPGVGGREFFLSIITVPLSGGKYLGEGSVSPSLAY